MNLKKCLKGHLFDRDKFTTCPFCGSVQWSKEQSGPEPKTIDDSKNGTVMLNQTTSGAANQNPPQEEYVVCLNCRKKNVYAAKFCEGCGKPLVKVDKAAQEQEKKLLANQFKSVVGWLVGIRGLYFGKSFSIRPGRNAIGNSTKSAINLSEDKLVSDEHLAWLTFDPKKNIYYISPGEGTGLIYVNNEVVLVARLLIPKDRIEIGDGEYIFVPLCDSNFKWSEYMKGSTKE